jgi:hypothetical protein
MRFFIVILFTIVTITAETNLSGPIGGTTFDKSGNPYIITGDILIDAGEKTEIKAGCIFLFNNFSGLKVNGELIVDGTAEFPVVFTSINDSEYNSNSKQAAAAFDWNGINFSNKASTILMSNFVLAYSVYGIKSEKEAFTVVNGKFIENRQFNITVNNEILPVEANALYSYSKILKDDIPTAKIPVDTTNQVPKKDTLVLPQKPKVAVPVIIGVTGLLSGAACGIVAVQFSNTRADYRDERDAAERSKLKSKGEKQLVASAACCGVSVIALTSAIVITVRKAVFNKDKSQNGALSLIPINGLTTSGAVLSIDF